MSLPLVDRRGKVADDAAYRMHVAKVCAVLAASLAILTGMSYTRTQFAKKDVSYISLAPSALLNHRPD